MIPAGAIRKESHHQAVPGGGGGLGGDGRTPEEAGVFQGLGIKFDQLVERGVLVPCAGGRYYVDQCKSGWKKGGASAGSASLFSLCRYSPAPQSFPAPGPDFYGI